MRSTVFANPIFVALIVLGLVAINIILSGDVLAQSTPLPTPSAAVLPNSDELEANPPSPPTETAAAGYLSTKEFISTLTVSGMGLVALLMEFFLLRRSSRLKSEDILRVFAVTFIIFGTLFLVTVGYGSDQIAPAMGLFGTVAGYLLGRHIHPRKEANENE